MRNEKLTGVRWWIWLSVMVILCALMICTAGCTRRIYVPVESVSHRTDTLMVAVNRTDTVLNSDTVRVRETGDSVIMEIVKWRTRVRERRDTVYRAKSDTVFREKPYPVETVREVPRKRAWWETALLWAAGLMTAAAAIRVAIRMVLKRQNQG